MKRVIDEFCPPILKRQLWRLKLRWMQSRFYAVSSSQVQEQDLDVYWDQSMANALEQWGKGSVWDEIQYLLINCHGKVLDVACGPGGTMLVLAKYPELELYGIDISDLLKQGKILVRMEERSQASIEQNKLFRQELEHGTLVDARLSLEIKHLQIIAAQHGWKDAPSE